MTTKEQLQQVIDGAFDHIAGFTDSLIDGGIPVNSIMALLVEIYGRTAQKDQDRQQQHLDALALSANAMAEANRARFTPRKPGAKRKGKSPKRELPINPAHIAGSQSPFGRALASMPDTPDEDWLAENWEPVKLALQLTEIMYQQAEAEQDG
jgi:hypothetical protein